MSRPALADAGLVLLREDETRAQPHASSARRLLRFVLLELGVWAALYGAYLAVRALTIGSREMAVAHAWDVIGIGRADGVLHEAAIEDALSGGLAFFSAYYMLGFAPLLIGVLAWVALRHPHAYRDLRAALLLSVALAALVFVAHPMAPPRLVEGNPLRRSAVRTSRRASGTKRSSSASKRTCAPPWATRPCRSSSAGRSSTRRPSAQRRATRWGSERRSSCCSSSSERQQRWRCRSPWQSCRSGLGLSRDAWVAAFTSFNTTTPILAVMIGLGVAIAYALFIVMRFRRALAEGASPVEAAVTAGSRAGRAVIFAGLTVAISISGARARRHPVRCEDGLRNGHRRARRGLHGRNAATGDARDLLADGFGRGFNGPMLVAVDQRQDPGAAEKLTDAFRSTPGVARVNAPILNTSEDTDVQRRHSVRQSWMLVIVWGLTATIVVRLGHGFRDQQTGCAR